MWRPQGLHISNYMYGEDFMNDTTDKMHFYIFTKGEKVDYSMLAYSDSVNVLNIIDKSISGLKISNYNFLTGVYWAWKNDSCEYIGFSLGDICPNIEENSILEMVNGNSELLFIKADGIICDLHENYRSLYYDYDFRICLEVLKQKHKDIYDYAIKNVIYKNEFILPTYIFRKDRFRKLCLWLFPILEECSKNCSNKKSNFQNKYLEHLSYYLINFYIFYHYKKMKVQEVDSGSSVVRIKNDVIKPLVNYSEQDIVDLIDEGEVEKAISIVDGNVTDVRFNRIKKVLEDYKRQKRHYRATLIDRTDSIKNLLNEDNVPRNNKKAKALVFKWNSLARENIPEALEELGIEVHYIEVSDIKYARERENLEVFNSYLDKNSFDFVISFNYLDILSEACYVHGIPYIAWAYDSPIDFGERDYLKYDTTHAFLFDTAEVYDSCIVNGYKNVKYMPLAVNCDSFDNITITESDKEHFGSSISFVGRLYESNLSEYMRYLSDYEKSYLNGIIDSSVGKYNADIIYNVAGHTFSQKLVKNREFIQAVAKGEGIDANSNSTAISYLYMLLNKNVTNRERLILLSMLSNHYDLKLYSDTSHSILEHVKQMGAVDYYTEMPKVFKLSKINLNITLRQIRTGIPLRCLDIMGCGGFLMSNYQADFEPDFKDGYNVALFTSLEDAYDKCDYYLSHEDVRKKIAARGYETVKTKYSYTEQIKKMITESGLGYLLE